MRITAALNPEFAEEYNGFFTDNSKCLRLIKSFPGIDGIKAYRKEWNSDMNILVFRDGVLHLDKYVELRKNGGNLAEAVTPHSPDLLVTQMSDTSVMEALNPEPDAVAFLDGFLNDVMPDPEVLRYMLTGIGSSLTDCSRDAKVLILQGEAGRNGKTSFLDCLSATMGNNYYGSADAENFRMGGKDPSRPNPQLDKLRDVRLAAFSEVSPAIVLDVAALKSFWGGSDVTIRTLYEEGSSFKVRFRGLFDLNCMPKLSDPSDLAFKKRLRIIPWRVSFYGREKPEVQRRLQEDEHVHAAMLNRLLDGLFRWVENGKMLDRGGADIPVGVQATTDEYYAEIDDIEAYIEGFLDITNAPDDFLTVDEILTDYARSGGTDIRKNTFSKQLRRKLADIGQTNANVKEGRAYMADGTRPRGWFGLRLKRLSDMELVDKANAETTGRRWSSYDVAELRGMVDKKKLRAIQAVEAETPVKTAESHAPAPQIVEAMKCTSTKIKTLDDHRADWGYTAEEIPF
jgi:phage/plasmid-associated DNA primase